MSEVNQVILEGRADDLSKTMLLLLNSKNEAAKKNLFLTFAQGNQSMYPGSYEQMAHFLSSQYAIKKNNKSNNNN